MKNGIQSVNGEAGQVMDVFLITVEGDPYSYILDGRPNVYNLLGYNPVVKNDCIIYNSRGCGHPNDVLVYLGSTKTIRRDMLPEFGWNVVYKHPSGLLNEKLRGKEIEVGPVIAVEVLLPEDKRRAKITSKLDRMYEAWLNSIKDD